MSKPWVGHDEALAELIASARWYEDEAEIGDDFIAVVEAGLAELERDPSVSTPSPGGPKGVRRLLLDRFPYAIVFVERADEYLVLAIAHLHRRPDYWKRRMPT